MWVKHPLLDEDTEITIGKKDGTTITVPVHGGVFEWPDDEPIRPNIYKPAAPPETLIREKKRREVLEKVEMAKAMGFTVKVPVALVLELGLQGLVEADGPLPEPEEDEEDDEGEEVEAPPAPKKKKKRPVQ